MPGAPDPEYVLARRVLQAVPTDVIADGVRTLLGEEISADVTEEALSFLQDLFSEPSRPGARWRGGTSGRPAGARRHDRRILRFSDPGSSPGDLITLMQHSRTNGYAGNRTMRAPRRGADAAEVVGSVEGVVRQPALAQLQGRTAEEAATILGRLGGAFWRP